jgi:hypothetical protein
VLLVVGASQAAWLWTAARRRGTRAAG